MGAVVVTSFFLSCPACEVVSVDEFNSVEPTKRVLSPRVRLVMTKRRQVVVVPMRPTWLTSSSVRRGVLDVGRLNVNRHVGWLRSLGYPWFRFIGRAPCSTSRPLWDIWDRAAIGCEPVAFCVYVVRRSVSHRATEGPTAVASRSCGPSSTLFKRRRRDGRAVPR